MKKKINIFIEIKENQNDHLVDQIFKHFRQNNIFKKFGHLFFYYF